MRIRLSSPTRTIEWIAAGALLVLAAGSKADIVPDRTLHDPPRSVGGPGRFLINESAGRRNGQNLFHSFQKFDLSRDESAEFRADNPINNVLVRVTGGVPSTVDGAVIVDPVSLPGANLYMINPSGIVIGPNARIDVSGSFTVTTADYIRLSEEGIFHASRPEQSVLTSAPPSAFGFIASAPAGVEIDGANARSELKVADGAALSVIAGSARITNRRLIANKGRISLVTRMTPGESSLESGPRDQTQGPVELVNAELSAVEGGTVAVAGNPVRLQGTRINIDTTDLPGGMIEIVSAGTIESIQSRLDANTVGEGDGGSIHLRADSIDIRGGIGDPSVISIQASTNTSTASLPGSGRSGNILIEANALSLTGVDSKGALVQSLIGGNGDGGNIDVVVSGHVLLDSRGTAGPTGFLVETMRRADQPTFGNAGRISISASSLELLNKGQLSSRTGTAGRAGNIFVHVGSLLIDGLDVDRTTGIDARVGGPDLLSDATGQGGTVVVEADLIEMRRGGVITVSTFAPADAGRLMVRAGDIRLTGSVDSQFTGMFARAALPTITDPGDPSRLGRGGDISIESRTLRIDGPAAISALAEGGAGAGNVTIDVSGDVLISRGGSVTVAAAQTNGGSIQISSGREISLLDSSAISASAGIDGGNITLIAPDLVRVDRSLITGQAGGDGGQITIDPTFVVLNSGTINGLAGGQDVRVRIDPNAILLSSNSIIESDSVFAPDPLDISSQLLDLQTTTREAGASLLQACVARFGKDFSSFVVVGAGGLPVEPGTPLPSFGDMSRDVTRDR